MSASKSRALVPISSNSIVSTNGSDRYNDFHLVNDTVNLQNRAEVKDKLPDILGRVLARAWLDKDFFGEFSCKSLSSIGKRGCELT